MAGYNVADITNYRPDMPTARATTALGGEASRRFGASNSEVVVALGHPFQLDPVLLAVNDWFTGTWTSRR